MNIPRLSIDNHQFVIIIFLLLGFAGVSSYLTMPRTENPEITIPGGSVYVLYPGANSSDLEHLIADPIEEAINELEDIKTIESVLYDGLAIISVEFIFGTDAKEKYNEMVQKVNTVRNQLPRDIFYLETMQWKSSDVSMLQIALVSDDKEYRELKDYGEILKNRIQQLREIRNVKIYASPEEEIRISLDMEKMAQMNISIEQVEKAIISNNANIPGGDIQMGEKSFSVKTSGSIKDLRELGNVVVSSYNGRIIYLKNISKIDYTYEDLRYLAKYNGKKGIFLAVTQKEGLNIFKITGKTEKIISEFEDELDPGIELNYVFDQSNEVEDKISNFLKNLLQGVILVGIVIFLSLGIKSAFIVMLAIPLSIIMGLHFIDLVGFGLEQISIAALVLALGLLVDNNIVMIENINRYLRMGEKPRDAAIKGASEVGWPIVSATATTLIAFFPIITMPDKAGEFIRSLPTTIIATLGYSLIIALTLTPLISSRLFKEKDHLPGKKESKENFVHRKLNKLIEGPYRRTITFALNRRFLTLSVAILILGLSGLVARYVGLSFFPKAEKPQFMIRLQLHRGASLEKTGEAASYVETILDTLENVKFYATNVGHGNPRIYYNLFSRNYDKGFAEIFVQLKEYDIEEFDKLITSLREKLGRYPGAEITIKEFEQGVPVASPIMIYIKGKNMDVLKNISEHFEAILKDQPGVVNAENMLKIQNTNIHISINKDKASLFGVPIALIDKTVRTAINGMTVSKFRSLNGEEYNIVLRQAVLGDFKVSDFNKIYVPSLSGRMIPLKQLARIEFSQEQGLIRHHNMERTALITADMEKGASLDDILNPVIEELDNFSFPKGYSYYIGGELQSRTETFGGMFNAIIIAAIAIFSVLVLQFRSFIQPLIIFAAIPFAIIGMIWALFLTGNTFSFTAFIGLISLVGIVINNSIILVDYTNKLTAEGLYIDDALQKAGETRFTPIILTSLTTIGGLLPLTLQGGTLWAPMGWTIIGGLLVSTFLTLVIVPVLYRVFIKNAGSGVHGA